MPKQREYIPNRIFVGLPWSLRKKYDPEVENLMKKYPIEFVIVGKDDRQDAEELLDIIKKRIISASYAVFDATFGNANVSLEYGYAEAIGVDRALYLSARKASKKRPSEGSAIISDLAGKKRNQYKHTSGLRQLLEDLVKKHPYTERFNRAMKSGSSKGGAKKRQRTLALKIIHAAGGDDPVQREKLIQTVLSDINAHKRAEIDLVLKKLHNADLLTVSPGRRAIVTIE